MHTDVQNNLLIFRFLAATGRANTYTGGFLKAFLDLVFDLWLLGVICLGLVDVCNCHSLLCLQHLQFVPKVVLVSVPEPRPCHVSCVE